ncbi:MAG: DUF5677 domain-containing protein [Actinomycetota bacterium]|jgi:hypothetical protein
MLTVPNLSLSSWLKDALPDFLWLCAHIADHPLRGMYLVTRALDVVDDVLKEHGTETSSWGRLTQFEGFPVEVRSPVLDALEGEGIYEQAFPEEFAHALGMYPDAPGRWLLDTWRRRGLSVDPEVAQRYLAPIIAESFHGQHLVPTRAKFVYIRGVVKAGRLHVPAESDMPELLSRYPERLTEQERSKTEPAIRATFGAMLDLDGDAEVRREWCQRFWRSNWSLYSCISPESPYLGGGEPQDRADVAAVLAHFRDASEQLRRRLEEVALRIDPDLYTPDRYEVLTGIATRVIRLVEGAAGAPLLWTDEYGAMLMRSVVEAKILIRWLDHKADPRLYTRFKDYGRGRLKLLKLHAEEYADSLEDVPDHLARYLEHLDAEVNADVWEEFQEISIDKTFSGVTARQMAIDVGLKSDYDFVFAPASGTTHGDWTALDRYALVRCRNPLHMWHRIPNFDVAVLVDPSVMQTVVAMADDVIDEYNAALVRTGN